MLGDLSEYSRLQDHIRDEMLRSWRPLLLKAKRHLPGESDFHVLGAALGVLSIHTKPSIR